MENNTKDNTGAPSVESLVKRGCLFLEDSDWNKANEYFDKALDINPEHAPAYVGKLCAELMVRREESLGDYNELRQGKKFDKLLGEYANFKKALRFADDSYKKKLNDYEQKIKENFPRIPQRFTDEFINGEIARLEKEIANCDAEIAKGEGEKHSCEYMMDYCRKENQRIYDIVYSVEGHIGAKYHTDNDKDYQSNKKTINDFMNKKNIALKYVKEYTGKKAEYEANKQEIEQLAKISCLDRMDRFYNSVAEAMKKASTEDEFKNLTEQLRLLEGYKDSAELMDKCGKMVIKAQYDKLVQEKNKAATEEEYRELSKLFRKMGGYENSAQLADECDKLADECVKQKEREKKARYDAMVQEKNNASSEEKYRQLTQEFRGMGNYENAVQLANECDKQMNVFKKQREEQERQERARIAARAAQERAEDERRRRREEEKERRKKLTKRIIGIMLTAVPFVLGLLLYYISCKESYWLKDGFIGILIGSLAAIGIPLVLIHFRKLFVLSIIVLLFAALAISLMSDEFSLFSRGSLAMIVAFIMALAYPKDKFWD